MFTDRGSAYYIRNKKRIYAGVLAWRRAHPEYLRERNRRYYQAHRAEPQAKTRDYQATHRKDRRKYYRNYYAAHRKPITQGTHCGEYMAAFPEELAPSDEMEELPF